MPNVIGLMVAEKGIRAVEISHGKKGPQLVAAGEVALPEGAALDSEVLDSDAVRVALNHLWAQADFKSRRVILGVANRRTLVREYTAPRLAPEVLKAALPFEVADLLPVPVEQAVLDFYPTGETADTITGLLVAAVSEQIEHLVNSIEKAKLQVDSVDFIPFGLTRALTALGENGPDTVAVAAIGEHNSSVVVCTEGLPRFVRIIQADLGMADAPRADAAGTVLDVDGWVAKRALPDTAARNADADPMVLDLVARVRSTLRFYSERHGGNPVQRLYLTGVGLACCADLSPQMAAGLSIPVQEMHVSDVITLSRSWEGQEPPSPSLVGALGIALGGVR